MSTNQVNPSIKVKSSTSKFNEGVSVYDTSFNDKVTVTIDRVEKSIKGYFTIYFNIRNTTDTTVNYQLEKAFFATEKGEQIKGITTRLVEYGSTDNDIIFPNLYVNRNVSFSNDLSEFSENDLFFCSLKVNNQPYALGSTLRNSNIIDVKLI